MKRDTGTS